MNVKRNWLASFIAKKNFQPAVKSQAFCFKQAVAVLKQLSFSPFLRSRIQPNAAAANFSAHQQQRQQQQQPDPRQPHPHINNR